MHDVTLPVRGGEVPLRIYVPHSSAAGRSQAHKGVLVWIHGESSLLALPPADVHGGMRPL